MNDFTEEEIGLLIAGLTSLPVSYTLSSADKARALEAKVLLIRKLEGMREEPKA